MQHFDIIIIGGGPSGAMCGIQLQKLGFSSCIIDKSTFPRTKLCGGLLTQKTINFLTENCPNINPQAFIVDSTNSVNFYNNTNKICNLKSRIPFYFTERLKFDSSILTEYKNLGGNIIENTHIKAKHICFDTNTITINSNSITYKYLVGADGCQSVLMQKTDITRFDLFCIEGETIQTPSTQLDCDIYFNSIKNGYGWRFPKSNYYTIGLGGDNQNKKLKTQAETFFKQIQTENIINIKGAFIPSGKLPKYANLQKNTLVIGDAAGLVDPITGEGIFYALHSGKLAAQAIFEANKKKDTNANKIFLKLLKPDLKEIAFAYKLQKLLFAPFITIIFLNTLKKQHGFALFYLEELMSLKNNTYQTFIPKYIYKKLKSKFTQYA